MECTKALQDELPTLQELIYILNGALEGRDDRDQLLEEMAQIIAVYPTGEDIDSLNPNATYIEDIPAFKQGLTISTDPSPMVEWGDLPTSKFWAREGLFFVCWLTMYTTLPQRMIPKQADIN